MVVNQDLLQVIASLEESVQSSKGKSIANAKRRGYPVMVGHTWSDELVGVIINEYSLFIEQGYNFDSLVNHFVGGDGFEYDHPIPGLIDRNT